MRWLRNAAVLAVAAATVVPAGRAAAVPSPVCVARTAPVATGLTLTGSKPLTARATDLTFRSAAMAGAVHAIVLLPTNYAANPTRRYPVLYLLHGHGGGGYLDWVRHGVADVVADTPLIVVMPDGGYDGWYSDWYGTDVDGHTAALAPAYESFHIRELIPYIDATYRTRADRSGRALAGNSMGGFGAESYAARHPDLFIAAGAFSGAVDPLIAWPVGSSVQPVAANAADQRPPDNCIWGDPVTQRVRWADHDPTTLAANLGNVAVYQRSGDGVPGRYNDPATPPSPGGVLTEFGVGLMNHDFDRALAEARVKHTAVFEHGVHDWPYWRDDLRQFLPMAMAAFASPPTAPPRVAFTYTTGRSMFAVWDWHFLADHEDEAALITVSGVTARGLVATGQGVLRVRTAALYKPGRAYRVNGRRIVASHDGRLRFPVRLRQGGTVVRIVGNF